MDAHTALGIDAHQPIIGDSLGKVFYSTSMFLDSSFAGLLNHFKHFYPHSNPLEWESYNPLSLHEATKDDQDALAQWLRMPLDSPQKKFWLKKLMQNPTVNFNFQNDLQTQIQGKDFFVVGKIDPRRLTILNSVLSQVLQMGDKESFVELLDRGIKPNVQTQKEVLLTGDLDLAKRVFEFRELRPEEYLGYASHSGNINLLEYLLDRLDFQYDRSLCRIMLREAAKKGRLELIKYMLEERNDIMLDDHNDQMAVLIHASKSESIKTIVYISKYWNIEPNSKCLYNAVIKGSLPIIKYFVETIGLVPDMKCLIRAADEGNLMVSRYLVSYGKNRAHFYSKFLSRFPRFGISFLEPDIRCLNHASRSGNIHLVRYFIEDCNIVPRQKTLDAALDSFNIHLIKYLINNYGLIPSDVFLKKAAKVGNIPFIKYLNETQNLPISEKAILSSCYGGHLEAFEYLIQKSGISPNSKCLDNAAQSGNLNLVKYIMEQHHIYPTETTLKHTELGSSTNSQIDYSELRTYLVYFLAHQNHQIQFLKYIRSGAPFI